MFYIHIMLTFTHTYLLHLAYHHNQHRDLSDDSAALILGNVIPDFITHLGRTQFQAIAHNLESLTSSSQRSQLEWGAIFHILCDNYSTLGRLTVTGNYRDLPKDGFVEKLSQSVRLAFPLRIPQRRILQCALDILVIREKKELLIRLLQAAESFLKANKSEITDHVAALYHIEPRQLDVGLSRFSKIYGTDFIELSASEEYRLFPLARSLLNLSSLTEPRIILESVRQHPELMALVESNMGLIQDRWQALLKETAGEVMTYPGIKESFL